MEENSSLTTRGEKHENFTLTKPTVISNPIFLNSMCDDMFWLLFFCTSQIFNFKSHFRSKLFLFQCFLLFSKFLVKFGVKPKLFFSAPANLLILDFSRVLHNHPQLVHRKMHQACGSPAPKEGKAVHHLAETTFHQSKAVATKNCT